MHTKLQKAYVALDDLVDEMTPTDDDHLTDQILGIMWDMYNKMTQEEQKRLWE